MPILSHEIQPILMETSPAFFPADIATRTALRYIVSMDNPNPGCYAESGEYL